MHGCVIRSSLCSLTCQSVPFSPSYRIFPGDVTANPANIHSSFVLVHFRRSVHFHYSELGRQPNLRHSTRIRTTGTTCFVQLIYLTIASSVLFLLNVQFIHPDITPQSPFASRFNTHWFG
ncbi:hypothetical protein BDR03DRAFT_961408 [Suillus americanus]|nr:hypothetical protein BDR03DRAFT_961408 [Suillus americanus]